VIHRKSGEPKRKVNRVKLRVIGGSVTIDDHVPATRADCPKTRPCPHVRCRHHGWLTVGEDRPGRRHPGEKPRQATIRLEVLMSWPVLPSCALDIIEQAISEDWSLARRARALDLATSGFTYIGRKAVLKLARGGANTMKALREIVAAQTPGIATWGRAVGGEPEPLRRG
jgi:hypothetical protein